MAHDHGEDLNTQGESPSTPEREFSRDVSEDVLELDYVFEALAHPRRRYLLYTLAEETTGTLDDLARQIAAWEQDVPAHDVSERQRKLVSAALYHAHVPKLTDIGVVTYDEQTATIQPAEHVAQVQDALAGMGASLDAAQETHAREPLEDQEDDAQ